MKKLGKFYRGHTKIIVGVLAAAAIAFLMGYRLGSLTGGLSITEQHTAASPVGLHGIYHNAFYLPIKLLRSIDFFIFNNHGMVLTRLPNAVFGVLALASFAWLIKLWHGNRIALMSGILFACSAWFLHVSRLASFDVLYLCALPMVLLGNTLLHRYPGKASVYYGNGILWGLLLYVPGMIWLLALNIFLERAALAKAWRQAHGVWRRTAWVLLGVVWLPLLISNLLQTHAWKLWLGLPMHLAPPLTLLKQFAGVFVHLFIRGPEYPQLWLKQAPVLDIFTLAMCIIGILFYARHLKAARTRTLVAFFVVGAILVGLGGPVGLSLVVPLAYVVAATGLAYLLREWLRVFPSNPLARTFGIGLLCIAIALSCAYNLRAYFVAWPGAEATKTVFRYYQ